MHERLREAYWPELVEAVLLLCAHDHHRVALFRGYVLLDARHGATNQFLDALARLFVDLHKKMYECMKVNDNQLVRKATTMRQQQYTVLKKQNTSQLHCSEIANSSSKRLFPHQASIQMICTHVPARCEENLFCVYNL